MTLNDHYIEEQKKYSILKLQLLHEQSLATVNFIEAICYSWVLGSRKLTLNFGSRWCIKISHVLTYCGHLSEHICPKIHIIYKIPHSRKSYNLLFQTPYSKSSIPWDFFPYQFPHVISQTFASSIASQLIRNSAKKMSIVLKNV